MRRPAEDGVARTGLDDPAQVHDGDVMADVAHHAQVVRDEDIGQAQVALQVHQQVDDLRLQARPAPTPARRRRSAPVPAPARARSRCAGAGRRLVRIALGGVGPQADAGQQLGHAFADGGAAVAEMRSGSPMMSRTRMRGFIDENGSWKMNCMRRRMARSCSPFIAARSWPSSRMRPSVGSVSRIRHLPVVDLPQPDSPTRLKVWPRGTDSETPSTARRTRPPSTG